MALEELIRLKPNMNLEHRVRNYFNLQEHEKIEVAIAYLDFHVKVYMKKYLLDDGYDWESEYPFADVEFCEYLDIEIREKALAVEVYEVPAIIDKLFDMFILDKWTD